MEKDGGYMNSPPLLNGSSNYDQWKSKMTAFLRSIDSKVWKVVLTGWECPTYTSKEGTSTGVKKPEVEWTPEEETAAHYNHKAIYALFNGVDASVFKLIKNCVSAKEAWEILEKCYEGTTKVKQSKIQHLTSKFESLRMKDDESIQDFHLSLLDIANSFEALGEKISDEKLSRKLLRSLPKRFDMKVTAIEEAHDISTMKMDELVGSLQTFEIVLNERGDKKNKSIAFVSNTDDSNDQSEDEEEDSIADAIAMLGRQFNKVLKRVGGRNRQNGQSIQFDINKQQNSLKKTKSEEKSSQGKGVQCHECEGYGHIRSECGTYQKRQKKGLTVSWSDEDTDEESESARHATALTGTCVNVEDWESDEDGDVSYEELASTYKELVTRYEEMCRILEKQKKTINKLQAEVNMQVEKATQAEEKVIQVNAQMDDLRKRVSQLNSGANLLEEILDNVPSGKLKSVGYNYSSLNQYQQNPETKFTSSEEVFDPCTGKVMLEHQTQHSKAYPVPKFALDPKSSVQQRPRPFVHQRPKNQRRYRRWVCHHCGKRGHIRPFCYKLYGYPNQEPKPNVVQEENVIKKEWRPKEENVGLIAHTSLRASSREDWYFDSGCSRHMTGEEKYLINVRSYKASFVTFGDGAKGEIIGIGDLISHGLPNLENVLLVKGLTANLISISQLCDQGMKVNFTKSECLVNNEEGQLLMKGTRSKDNCYLWMSQEEAHTSTCLISTEDEVQLWHQKLGHLNLKGMKKAMTAKAIRGLPRLKIIEGNVCGECQIGKQTRMSHPMLEHQTTSKVLKVLHMDLMGPMQVESLGGKSYAFVVVDDYSRYTWVNFIREKLDAFDVFKELCTQIQREKASNVVRIRSDHGREFKKSKFNEFFSTEGIKHEYSSPITPQQNGVVERKVKETEVAAEATKSEKKKIVGPTRRSSRVEIPSKQKKQSSKRKTPKKKKTVGGASGKDVEDNAPSIVSSKRRIGGRFIPPNVPDVLVDNVSFHFIDGAAKWKYVFARRVGLERELSDEPKFVKLEKVKFTIAQIYVDDIVFGGMSNTMVQHFVKQMQSEFEISLVGKLTYFLGLQIKQMLKEYNVEQDALTLYCDNMSAINISKNPVQHNKHIDIRHHFIRDLVESKIVTLEHVGTKEQVADIFTKALDAVQFEKLRGKLGICLYEEL
ncbi:gag-protease polyprotein [Trifolium repens]|nr:gag-protease polyprotein [Trifolium repens]